jgi:hypothetical protein
VPEGGLVNQVLVKQSNEDYDTIWKTIQTSGGGENQTFSARVLSTSSTTGSPEANVSLSDTNEFQFSFKLQKGIDGTNGKDGSPGKDGAEGPMGATGVSGTPGVGIVMRFCNGTDDTPSKSKPSNILDTTSQG